MCQLSKRTSLAPTSLLSSRLTQAAASCLHQHVRHLKLRIQNVLCGSNSLFPNLPSWFLSPDAQPPTGSPVSFPFSLTAPSHPQSISDWSLNPFCSLYCHPASKPSARLTWINKTASQMVFCSLLLIPTHLVVIPCLQPFHGLSLHPEIKPKLPVQVPRPLISSPSALSLASFLPHQPREQTQPFPVATAHTMPSRRTAPSTAPTHAGSFPPLVPGLEVSSSPPVLSAPALVLAAMCISVCSDLCTPSAPLEQHLRLR